MTVADMVKELEMEKHHELPRWQKIVFPIWIWKSLMHDKHEAFRFKYDTQVLNEVEKNMNWLTVVLYVNAVLFYTIVFSCPFIFGEPCGEGISFTSHKIYAGYSVINGVLEGLIVVFLQHKVHDKTLLKLNKWHFVELIMG